MVLGRVVNLFLFPMCSYRVSKMFPQVLNVFLNMLPISTTLSYILHSKFYSWNLDNHPKGEKIFGTVQKFKKDAHQKKKKKKNFGVPILSWAPHCCALPVIIFFLVLFPYDYQ